MAVSPFGLLLGLVLLVYVPSPNTGEVKLGLLIPFKETASLGTSYHRGEFYASAMSIAVDDINRRPDLLPGQNVSFIWNDTRCDELQTLQSIVWQLNEGVTAFIGPGCSCNTSARMAASFNKTMISYMCSNPEVSYKKLYPTFSRTIAIDTKLTPSLLSLLKYFNWKRVAIIYENVTKWIQMKNNMVKRLRAKGITVAQELLSHPSGLYRPQNHTDFFRDIFRKIKEEARIVIFVSSFHMAREGMLQAYDEGMTDGDYVFIMFVLDQSQMSGYTKLAFKWFFSSYKTSINRYHHVKKAFEAAFVLAIKSPSSQRYPNFTAELKKRSRDAPFYSKVYEGYLWKDNSDFPANKTEPPIYGAYLYDAVYQFAFALNKTMAKNQSVTGKIIAENLQDIQYDSILGYKIHFDMNGDVEFNLTLLDMQAMPDNPDDHEMVPVGDFQILFDNETNKREQVFIRWPNVTIHWPGGRTGPPRDSPECGFHGELCIEPKGEGLNTISIVLKMTLNLWNSSEFKWTFAGILTSHCRLNPCLNETNDKETKKRQKRLPGFKPDEILILQGYSIALQGTPLINVRLAVKSKNKVIPKEILHHLVLEVAPEVHRRLGHGIAYIDLMEVDSNQAPSVKPKASVRNSDEPDSVTSYKSAVIALGVLLGVVCLVAIMIVMYFQKTKREKILNQPILEDNSEKNYMLMPL